VIDFGEVEFLDMHGLVLLRDLCEVIRIYGVRAFAYRLSGELQQLLGEMEMLNDLGEIKPEEFALRSA